MNHHTYYAAAEALLDEISAEDDTVGRAMIAIFGTEQPDEEMPGQEHDPSICVCGDPWCKGCPGHDELVAEGIIGEAGE